MANQNTVKQLRNLQLLSVDVNKFSLMQEINGYELLDLTAVLYTKIRTRRNKVLNP